MICNYLIYIPDILKHSFERNQQTYTLPPSPLLSALDVTAEIMIDIFVTTCSEGPYLRERSLGYDCFESSHFNDIVGLFTMCIEYLIQMRWLQLYNSFPYDGKSKIATMENRIYFFLGFVISFLEKWNNIKSKSFHAHEFWVVLLLDLIVYLIKKNPLPLSCS